MLWKKGQQWCLASLDELHADFKEKQSKLFLQYVPISLKRLYLIQYNADMGFFTVKKNKFKGNIG